METVDGKDIFPVRKNDGYRILGNRLDDRDVLEIIEKFYIQCKSEHKRLK